MAILNLIKTFANNHLLYPVKKSEESDAVLVLNFDKIKDNVIYPNYIGGATFLEMYDSYLLGHDIFLYNTIPDGMLKDEIEGMEPILLNGNLLRLKEYNEKQKKKEGIIC